MKKYNVIVVFDKDLNKTLMCKTKDELLNTLSMILDDNYEKLKEKMMVLMKRIEN